MPAPSPRLGKPGVATERIGMGCASSGAAGNVASNTAASSETDARRVRERERWAGSGKKRIAV